MASKDLMSFEKTLQNPYNEEEKEKMDHFSDGLSNGLPNTTARKNMPGFMFETKYVMLNFMSLIPPDLFSGHITSSPESLVSAEISTTDHLTKSHPLTLSSGHSLRKSQSVDTGLHKSHPRLKHIHKLKSYQQLIDSPASDDNLGYKYRINCDRAMSHGNIQTFHPEIDTLHTLEPEPYSPHHTDHSLSDIPRSATPSKSSRGLYRMASDISSSGDFSYISDADDEAEFEDTSNASSLFSSHTSSVTCRDGFLDLRKSNYRLSTLRSQSEDSDDVDGLTFVPRPRHSFDLQDVPEEKEMSISPQADEDDIIIPVDCSREGNLESVRRRAADRSKLKLEIPCPPVQLSDILVSLQSEMNSEMSELETEYEEVVKSAKVSLQGAMAMATPLTPQSQAAQVLARIGDEVKYKYEHKITEAVNKYLIRQAGSMSYNLFKEIAQEIVDKSLPGWRQVALLLVFGQRVLWSTVQQGNKEMEVIIDYCSQLVSDVAAEFIIKEGGWGSVMNSDPSLSSDTQSSGPDAYSPPCILEYFSNLEVKQVDSTDNAAAIETDTRTGNFSTGDINYHINSHISLQQTYTVNKNTNAQIDNKNDKTEAGVADAPGTSLKVDESHVKQRLQSFGFDLRHRFESESRAESDQQSLDYIQYVPDDSNEEEKLSTHNSDIFVETVDDSPIDAGDNQEGSLSNGDFVDWGGIIVQTPQQNMISVVNSPPNEVTTERNIDNSVDQSFISTVSTLLCNNDVDTVQMNERSTEEQDSSETLQDTSNQTEEIGVKEITENSESERGIYEVEERNEHLDENNTVNKSSDENAIFKDEEQNEPTASGDWHGSFRIMGVKVVIATMAVLGAGVALKIATLNR